LLRVHCSAKKTDLVNAECIFNKPYSSINTQ
jgi:hypothetical protein